MGLVSGIVVYVVLWWLVFFMTLPVGVKAQDADGGEVVEGTHSSAPQKPHLLKKMAFSFVVASILWGAFYWFIESGIMTLRGN